MNKYRITLIVEMDELDGDVAGGEAVERFNHGGSGEATLIQVEEMEA